jgi:hypothetical protein
VSPSGCDDLYRDMVLVASSRDVAKRLQAVFLDGFSQFRRRAG